MPSKVIKSVEDKGLVDRVLGDKDKRQMYFSLSEEGKKRLSSIKCDRVEIPELLKNVPSQGNKQNKKRVKITLFFYAIPT